MLPQGAMPVTALATMTDDIRQHPSPISGTTALEVHAPSLANPTAGIVRRLAERIGPFKYDMWFGRTRLQAKGDRVEVATDSPFVAAWIDSHYTGDLRCVVRETLGDSATVQIKVAPDLMDDEWGR